MAPHKKQALNPHSSQELKTAPRFQLVINQRFQFSSRVQDILAGNYERNIEILHSLWVLENKEVWNQFKQSELFNKNKFPFLLAMYLKVHLWLKVY